MESKSWDIFRRWFEERNFSAMYCLMRTVINSNTDGLAYSRSHRSYFTNGGHKRLNFKWICRVWQVMVIGNNCTTVCSVILSCRTTICSHSMCLYTKLYIYLFTYLCVYIYNIYMYLEGQYEGIFYMIIYRRLNN